MEELKLPSHEIPSKLDPRIIERWIDDTLADWEYLDIPGVILKPDSKTGDGEFINLNLHFFRFKDDKVQNR